MQVMSIGEYPVNRVLATRRPVKNLTIGLSRPDTGHMVWMLVDADLAVDEQGNVRQVIVTFMDITERREAEKR